MKTESLTTTYINPHTQYPHIYFIQKTKPSHTKTNFRIRICYYRFYCKQIMKISFYEINPMVLIQ